MAFINQFPYSDFHELNLDWLIKITKENNEKVKYLIEEFEKIQVLTEDQINAMIAQAIEANNIVVYQSINQVRTDLNNRIDQLNTDFSARLVSLDQDITARYKAYTDAQIALQKIYIDNQDTFYFEQAKLYSDTNLAKANAYTDNKVLSYTMMINPITGVYEDVRNVVDDIVSYFHTGDSLTAGEYDALELTADDYDAYQLTAYDYDFNGKVRLTNP